MSTHDLDLALRSADTLWLITSEGRVAHGAPEDLILRGVLQSTFSSSELIFDSDIGGFRPRPPAIGNALLIADGLSRTWMHRALEREGFRVLDSRVAGEQIDFEIVADDSEEAPIWRLKTGGIERHCPDIGSSYYPRRQFEQPSRTSISRHDCPQEWAHRPHAPGCNDMPSVAVGVFHRPGLDERCCFL